jgi:cell cycle sensor histidine kinase DivJ
LSNISEFDSPSVAPWIEQLTHESVADRPLERLWHTCYIAPRLAAAALVLLGAPIWLLLNGARPLPQGGLFLLMLAPLIAVAALKRTGDLRLAENISIVGWFALAIAVDASTAGYEPVCVALLAVALAEAACTRKAATVVVAGAGAIAALALDAGFRATHMTPLSATLAPMAALFAAPLLLYLVALAWFAIRAQEARTRADRRPARDLRLLTEAVGEIVLHFDRGGAVMSVVGDKHKSYGLEPGELIARGFFQRVHVADRPAFLKLVSDAVASSAPVSALLRVRVGATENVSGRFIEPVFNYFEARACFIAGDAEIETAPVVCILRDVTAAKRAEEEIAAARRETEHALAGKTLFLANVSHELRTPLNAIIGFSEMLGNEHLEPREPAKRREYAKIISDSGHHLLEVVNSILDMSKIQSGSMQILSEPFALPTLVDQCCDMMQLKADQTNVTLARDYPSDLEELVADKRACKQIIINLLSNAVKFTPPSGRVQVRLRPDGNFLVMSVIDSGVGIAAADLARVGDPFFQASSSHDRAYEGTGLGLSVVRGLVGLHGGSIAIESAPKLGTSVTVRLPLDCRAHTNAISKSARIEIIARHGAIAHGADVDLAQEPQVVKKIA